MMLLRPRPSHGIGMGMLPAGQSTSRSSYTAVHDGLITRAQGGSNDKEGKTEESKSRRKYLQKKH
ncbi:hypothetical protein KP509_20G046600 [Ceratopteris richardii]|uniref:Uncharacterized protein n=1 Tax=Ceratopteris richardii TaxID=49495 RepID=A0A8T2SGS3_CERRI|nr:hypothetical protein KP509_20G046600 [Ceratopteris richardii]